MLPDLEQLVLPAAVALTSLGAYVLARRILRLPGRHLHAAVGAMFECIGLTVIFFIANTMAGAAVVHALRVLPVPFVALYATTDIVLVLLSLLQALILYGWRVAGALPARDA